MLRLTLIASSVALATCLAAANAGDPPAQQQAPAATPAKLELPAADDAKPRDYPGLHNVVCYGPGLYSGSAPDGAAGFRTLKALGIASIISVDGAAPEVELAKGEGLRYVHLPIGYNGFDETRRLELARAARDLAKPIYVHCHHGKHRSAGALASISVTLGVLKPEQATSRMKVSGTAEGYQGLWACPAKATVATMAELDKVPADFPEVSRPQGIVKAMVEVDEVDDHLKLIEKAGWKVPADHPDLVPAAEMGRLSDLLRLANEDPKESGKPAEFHEWMTRASKDAAAIEDLLANGTFEPADLSNRFKAVASSCKECHAKYRD